MPNYSRLLLSTGGGVVNAQQQADQEPVATVAIGIGGTGCDCLKQLKTSVYNRIRPDDKDAPIPTYKHIRFLAVDTDIATTKGSKSVGDLDKMQEFFDLSVPDANAVMMREKNNAGMEWLNADEIRVLAGGRGANGVRQVGRTLLLTKVTSFIKKLENLINSAKMDLAVPKVNIFIFAGVGGGTGSGMFLDVCYLVQHVLVQMGIVNKQICGFAFLPDVNLSAVTDPGTRTYIQANGFSCMREIDYCMNLEESGGEWQQPIGYGKYVNFSSKPVNLLHLVTATDAAGGQRDQAYEYSMNVVTDFVLDFIAKNEQQFSLDSHINNFRAQVNAIPRTHGANYDYCVIGGACAEVPYKDILTYLASGMYKRYSPIMEQKPTREELDAFIKLTKFGYDQLKREFNKDADTKAMVAPSYDEYPEFRNGGNKSLIDALNKVHDEREGLRARNADNMLRKVEDYSLNNAAAVDASSVVARIYGQLIRQCTQFSKGPYYAKALLSGMNKDDLIAELTGYIRRAEEEIISESVNKDLRQKEMDSAKVRFTASNAMTRKGNYKKYAIAAVNYYEHLSKVNELTNFCRMLNSLKTILNELPSRFQTLCDMITELNRVFAENHTALENGVSFTFVDNTYCQKLMEISDLKDRLDETIREMPVETYYSNLITEILNVPEIWEQDDRIVSLVAKHFEAVFSEYANKSMNEYLEERFQIFGDPQRLIDAVYDEILEPMRLRATPLFWLNGAFDMSIISSRGYCSGPKSCACIMNAAQRFAQNYNVYTRRPSKLNDRISISSFHSGLPMMAYQGLRVYKSEYHQNRQPGQYSHERDYNWAEILPYPSAVSFDEVDGVQEADEKQSIVNLRNIYDRARNLGILKTKTRGAMQHEDPELYVQEIDFDALSGALDAAEERLAQDPKQADAVVTEIDALFADLPVLSEWKMYVIAAEEFVERVRFDNFVRYNAINTSVKDAVEKLEQLKKRHQELKTKFDQVQNAAIRLETFKKAVCSGIVFVVAPNVNYLLNDEDGFPLHEGELSKPSAKYGMIPLYQAYVSFCELDSNIVNGIESAATRTYDDVTAMATVLKRAKDYMTPENINNWVDVSKTMYSSDSKQIISILKEINQQVKAMAIAYGVN